MAHLEQNNIIMDDSNSESDNTIDYNFDSELNESLRVKASERGKRRVMHTELWRNNARKRCRNEVPLNTILTRYNVTSEIF